MRHCFSTTTTHGQQEGGQPTTTMYGQKEGREPSTFFDFVEIGETTKVQRMLEDDQGLSHAKDTCVFSF